MEPRLTFGEYLHRLRRRKRWQLAQVASATGLSPTHLSRLENDNAVPNPDTVVRLAAALDGDLNQMLELADCLPREILDRLIGQAAGSSDALRRAAGHLNDPAFGQVVVEDMDPKLRHALAVLQEVDEDDTARLYDALGHMARLPPQQREPLLRYITSLASEDRVPGKGEV